MSSGGSKNQTTTIEPPGEFSDAFGELGRQTNTYLQKARRRGTFASLSPEERLNRGSTPTTRAIPEFGDSFRTTLSTGGFTPFNADDLRAQQQGRQLAGGVSPELGQAGNIFRNNAGVSALQGINVGQQQRSALSDLRGVNFGDLRGIDVGQQGQNALGPLRNVGFGNIQNYTPEQLAALRFEDLQSSSNNPAFDYLQATARGDYLSPDSNPFLADAIRAAQDPVLEAFSQDILPGITGQFGGGFGLGGSAAINATRRAGEDVSDALSRDATQAYASAYQQERGLQEGATQFLGDLDLRRALGLGELDLSRAGQIDQLGLEKEFGLSDRQLQRGLGLGELGLGFTQADISRASELGNLDLQRGTNIGQLGLGFTQADIQRGSALGGLENQRAQGLLGVGAERRGQELQNVQLLSDIGRQQREQQLALYGALEQGYNAPVDDQLQRLGLASGILGSNTGGTTIQSGGAGTNRLTSGLGGALTGAAIGGQVGGPYGALAGGVIGGTAGVIR